MDITSISIDHYRSIEHISLAFPSKKPLILFGPNNAGKSNILSAINRLVGDRYPTYIEMLDSDYFMRNREDYPTASITASFSEPIHYDNRQTPHKTIAIRYGNDRDPNDHLLHDGEGRRLYLSNEQRSACQSYLIDAERNIQSAFNYSSKYSLLSRFSHRIHDALSTECKEELSLVFEQIKASFERTEKFAGFFQQFTNAMESAVKGFVHSLAVDFSAYDPNNYAKSLRIFAKEGDNVRGFEEFGTGEQQVLLMAFVKAYMQVFTAEHFVLIIEEPEAHLHPLAQKWLKEYVVDMCSEGIQVVLSTHSTDFIDAAYIDGLVRVYKEAGITKAVQLSPKELCSFCIESGVPESRVSPDSIVDYYATKLFSDQLKGMFADTIILVEGATEYFCLPVYLKRIGLSLAEHGIEIVNCMGKESIPLYWRLFKAYGFNCFIIFDCDSKPDQTERIFQGIISCDTWETKEEHCVVEDSYMYFGKDFETYLRSVVVEYNQCENGIIDTYSVSSKPGKAKAVAHHISVIPEIMNQIKDKLLCIEMLGQGVDIYEETK